MDKLTYVLSIAGHDPSAGAGLTSDLKTMEHLGIYGLSVCTAITIQNDSDFVKCHWIPVEQIIEQTDILFKRFEISVVKIGIVESLESLKLILFKLKELNPNIKIVLDPILKATAGYDFHTNEVHKTWFDVWKNCFIVTPNFDEIQQLNPRVDWKTNLKEINQFTNVYLKGGHRKDKLGWDEVYLQSGELISIGPKVKSVYQKHGSGCVLSSALASHIALGLDLESACRKAKYYTEQFLNSHTSLLGVHSNIKTI